MGTPTIEIVNPAGVPIPIDEPLLLFRARDRHVLAMLQRYRELCVLDGCTDYHLKGIDNRLEAFRRFREEHPERMKQPGITEGR
jgi:trehalose-6-phosphate synthase